MSTTDSRSICAAIRNTRRALGMRQRQLAEQIGISAAYMNEIERGGRPFPEERIPDLPPPLRRVVQIMRRARLSELLAEIEIDLAGLDARERSEEKRLPGERPLG